jgi:poly-gamma-glutamate synthesis protein (capsule biosynthesis protein)
MENKVVIRLMGDVMIGRTVNKIISRKGYTYPWGNVLNILKKDGINLINLETAITNSNKTVDKVFNFKADPDKINTLTEANIHGVNIANNHILDFSIEGMEETIKVLDEYGIAHTGAGRNLAAARTPLLLSYQSLTIGMLGCTDNEPGWEANSHPGTNYVRTGDLSRLREDISNLREKADIVIVSLHWGPNMVEEPSDHQVKFAHDIADIGADIIFGHSAHIFQGIEIYKGKIILYDTGDFIDDYVIDPGLRNDRSFLFEIAVTDKKISGLNLIPVVIDNMQVNVADEHDRKWSLARMQKLSSRFNTEIDNEGKVRVGNQVTGIG